MLIAQGKEVIMLTRRDSYCEPAPGVRGARRIDDHLWSFLMGLLVGTPTGVFSGVALVWALAQAL